MSRWLTKIWVALLAAFIAAQFIPVNRQNPAEDPSRSLDAKEHVPPAVKTILSRSCQNCHSNETSWPWYSYVAPASWMIAHDVHAARKKMNFSKWGDYTAEKREEKLEEICEQINEGDMPDPKYLWLHRSARMSRSDRETVCQWTEDSRQY